jgi:hypothetical protein
MLKVGQELDNSLLPHPTPTREFKRAQLVFAVVACLYRMGCKGGVSVVPTYEYLVQVQTVQRLQRSSLKIKHTLACVFVPIPVAARSMAWVCCRSLAGIAGANPAGDMDVFLFLSVVLWGRGLCDRMITRPEESYRVWCVRVWSRNLIEEA